MGLDVTTRKNVVGEPQRNYLYFIVIEDSPDVFGNVLHPFENWCEVTLYNVKAFFPEHKSSMINQPWAGLSFNLSGTDESTKTGSFSFLDDQKGRMFRFWSRMQELTGDTATRKAALGIHQNMEIGIGKVDVKKYKITSYSRLIRAKVSGFKASDPDPGSTGLSEIIVTLNWDRSEYDDAMRGTIVPLWDFGVQEEDGFVNNTPVNNPPLITLNRGGI